MKQLARSIVAKILGYQVKRLYKKNNIKVVGVVGSIGKTSTKLAIARVLSAKYKVRYQDGNYNDLVTVPLIFFGEPEPSLYNPLAWLATFWRNQRQVNKSYPYDVVVVELGSDTSGLISEFRAYLRLDIAVITAITPEHMEF
jgi:UDP-N-acetylmuramoyl-tripeptide--D-alanyl-D-alanine ligase